MGGAGPYEPLLFPTPRTEALRRRGLPPQDRGGADPAVPRGGRPSAGRPPVLVERRRGREGRHARERRPGAAAFLPRVEAGGEGGGGGARASRGAPAARRGNGGGEAGSGERCRDETPCPCCRASASHPCVGSSASPGETVRSQEEAPRVPSPTLLAPAPAPRSSTEPLTADLRRLHVTVSKRFTEKLEAARDALSHSHPGADVEAILEAGLDLLIERAAKRKGLVKRPRPAPVPQRVGTHATFPRRSAGRSSSGTRGSANGPSPKAESAALRTGSSWTTSSRSVAAGRRPPPMRESYARFTTSRPLGKSTATNGWTSSLGGRAANRPCTRPARESEPPPGSPVAGVFDVPSVRSRRPSAPPRRCSFFLTSL